MPHSLTLLAAGLALAATVAVAHQGVQNPAVMARMDAMSIVGDNTKLLGQMAKGEIAFDAGAARAAAAAIAAEAARTPALFQAPEDDPKSEAKPEIWQDFPDFTARAAALQSAAEAATAVTTLEELRQSMARIGATCAACHEAYRE